MKEEAYGVVGSARFSGAFLPGSRGEVFSSTSAGILEKFSAGTDWTKEQKMQFNNILDWI